MRSDISFKTTDGLALKGWLYLSGDAIAHRPAIVMAHGFTAVIEQYLDRYVELFPKHVFALLVYDNRNFGTSEDLLRQGRLAPHCKFVISGTQSPTSVASTPSMACGSVSGNVSYSCGHVLQVAASDRRVKCVSSQVPAINGSVDVRMTVRQDLMRGLVEAFEANRAARYVGDHPLRMNVVSEDLKSDRVLPGQDCFDDFIDSHTRVAPKSIELRNEYELAHAIDRISPTPLQIIVAQKDTVTIPDVALKSYERALQPKYLVPLDSEHCDPYLSQSEASSTAAVEWLKRHL